MRLDQLMFRQIDGGMGHHRRAADLRIQRIEFGLRFPHLRFQARDFVRRILEDLFGNGAARRSPLIALHVVLGQLQPGGA